MYNVQGVTSISKLIYDEMILGEVDQVRNNKGGLVLLQ
jgi:hypothetical protein